MYLHSKFLNVKQAFQNRELSSELFTHPFSVYQQLLNSRTGNIATGSGNILPCNFSPLTHTDRVVSFFEGSPLEEPIQLNILSDSWNLIWAAVALQGLRLVPVTLIYMCVLMVSLDLWWLALCSAVMKYVAQNSKAYQARDFCRSVVHPHYCLLF